MKFTCEKCGREFEASRFWARYCSDTCRQMAYDQRQREKDKEKPDPRQAKTSK